MEEPVFQKSISNFFVGPGAHKTCYFQSRANPSAGMVDFFQSQVCNLNNLCHNEYEEIPTYNGSEFNDLLKNAEPIFKDDNIKRGIDALPKAMNLIKGAIQVLNNSFIQDMLGNL